LFVHRGPGIFCTTISISSLHGVSKVTPVFILTLRPPTAMLSSLANTSSRALALAHKAATSSTASVASVVQPHVLARAFARQVPRKSTKTGLEDIGSLLSESRCVMRISSVVRVARVNQERGGGNVEAVCIYCLQFILYDTTFFKRREAWSCAVALINCC
jgi:hypothetical protein